jgi:hypothetical protein
VTRRPVRARLHSLCGTQRRMRKEEVAAATAHVRSRPCRYHAIWACQGMGERSRRLAVPPSLAAEESRG